SIISRSLATAALLESIGLPHVAEKNGQNKIDTHIDIYTSRFLITQRSVHVYDYPVLALPFTLA
ncbi:hypothetical protein LJB82_04040, partial [Desulfovibrio sp. OttesenSCG-928-M16]|nr:hypothetical protein [Desulfovibrio sp. OttesenSCG-928-M16]